MQSPITLRIDDETRERIARVAGRDRVSASRVIRDALEAWLVEHDAPVSPYEVVADLVGVVHGGDPQRSTDTGRRFSELLRGRRNCP